MYSRYIEQLKSCLIIVIILFAIGNLSVARSQEWEPKSFDSLSTDEDYQFEPDIRIFEHSKGWLPHPVYSEFNWGIFFSGGAIYDDANNILPQGAVPTNFKYSSAYNESDNHLNMREKFSDDEIDDTPDPSSFRIGIDYKLTPNWNIPLLFRAQTSLNWQSGLLFSIDKTKKFQEINGNIKSFIEIGNFELNELHFDANFSAMVPIYGLFLGEQANTSSIYYLNIGAGVQLPIYSEFTQYLQIGDVKHQLRYANGRDTLRLRNDYDLSNSYPLRFYGLTGLGIQTEFTGFGLLFEINYIFPFNSILKGDLWRQHQIEYKVSILFGELLY